MSDVIGSLAYKIRFDASQLTKGLMSTRTQLSAARKITESMASPLEKYINGLTNLNEVLRRNTDLEKHRNTISNQLEKNYLEEASAMRVLTKEEQKRLETLKYLERLQSGKAGPGGRRSAGPEVAAAYRAEQQARGKAVQAFFKSIDDEAAAGRKSLEQRRRMYHERKVLAEKAAKEEAAIQAKATAQAAAAYRAEQQARGLADQRRLQRYTTMVDAETAAARKGLAQRLLIYKEEKRRRMELMGRSAMSPGQSFMDSNTFAKGGDGASGGGGRIGSSMFGVNGIGLGIKAFAGFQIAKAVRDTAVGVNDFRKESEGMFASVERNTAAFEAFTQSGSKAKAFMNDIRSLSGQIGVSFDAMQSGATSMMGYSVAVEDVLPKLRQFSAITRGDPERMKTMSLAYGQVTAAGKLMGQELLQMVNSGFNPLAEISRTTGRNMTDLRKDMADGKITVDMVSNAFKSATEQGGLYNGVLEKIAATTSGASSRNQSAWDMAKTDIGEALAPITKFKLNVMTTFARDLSSLASLFKPVAVASQEIEKSNDKINKSLQERARIQEYLKTQAEQMKSDKEFAEQGLSGLSLETIRSDSTISKRDQTSFDRIMGLLQGVKKEQAAADFAQYKDLENIYSYLDKNVAQELKRTEAIIQQNQALEQQKALKKEGEVIERRHNKSTSFTARDTELEKIKKDREQLKQESLRFEKGASMQSVDQYGRRSPYYNAVESRKQGFNDRLTKLDDREKAARGMGPDKLSESDMSFASEIGKLLLMMQQGALKPDAFALERDRLAKESINYKPVGPAASIQAGSQEAYQQMIAGQMRGENKMLKEQQALKLIAKTQLTALQESNRLQKELNDKLDFETVGG